MWNCVKQLQNLLFLTFQTSEQHNINKKCIFGDQWQKLYSKVKGNRDKWWEHFEGLRENYTQYIPEFEITFQEGRGTFN